VHLHILIPPHIKAEFDRMADENRRALTTEILIALEDRLKTLGRLPPPTPSGSNKT
jgi:hypothetical protein